MSKISISNCPFHQSGQPLVKKDFNANCCSFLSRKKNSLMAFAFIVAMLFTITGETKAQTPVDFDPSQWTAVADVATGKITITMQKGNYSANGDYGLFKDAAYFCNITDNKGKIQNIRFASFDMDATTTPYEYTPIPGTSITTIYANSTLDTHGFSTDHIIIFVKTRYFTINNISITGNFTTYKKSDNSYNSHPISDSKPIVIPSMSQTTIISPDYSFLPNGFTRMAYSKPFPLSAIDGSSRIHLEDENDAWTTNFVQTSTRGEVVAPYTGIEKKYHFVQTNYDGYYVQHSYEVTVPALTLPNTLTSTYDTTTQLTSLSWSINAVPGANFVSNQFKIQQADNKDFNNATTLYKDYDPAVTTYNLPINSNLAPHLYFRINRDYPGFAWEVARVSNLDIQQNITPIDPATFKLAIQGGDTALIKWGALKSSWYLNGSFVITRNNKTTKTLTQIVLTKNDYLAGQYLDDQVLLCNEYTYTLQILPPSNSAFTTPALVKTTAVILPVKIGTVQNLTASKGYFPDRTQITWSATGLFDQFVITRAVDGTNNYIQLNTVNGTAVSNYKYDDSQGIPGVYYVYAVVGMVQCNKTAVYTKETLYNIGFRSPVGNIYGKVTYQNGQAVADVALRLQSDNTTLKGKSILLNGNPLSFLKLDFLNKNFADTALTFEGWIKPADAAPVNQVIFSRANQYEVGFDNNGALYFKHGINIVSGIYQNINQSFIHIAGICTKDSMLLMLNDSVVARVRAIPQTLTEAGMQVYLGTNGNSNNYKGWLDEIRVWNVAKTPAIIARDYTRMLTGGETGLIAYWRFDETVIDQFYDLSYAGNEYNQNDGNMNSIWVYKSSIIPTPDQLSFKGLTDTTGNYMIAGIPYTGNGVTYSIVPILGTHQFNPGSVNRLISPSSNEFTVDFTDNSSFPVSGTVFYQNSTIPVAGVQFKIDNQFAVQTDGTIFQTDLNGKFLFSVPVGKHTVQALKNGHVFVNGGKITDIKGNNVNYQAAVTERILTDSTTIKFIGRVAGGVLENAFPLGHSLSTNNLGKTVKITLGLSPTSPYDINSGTTTKSSYTIKNNHLLPADLIDSSKIHYSTVVYNKNSIEIYPDSITGEFVANLIPEKFFANHVTVTGWGDILNNRPVPLDFTNSSVVSTVINNYTDSVKTSSGYTFTKYADTVFYNASYKFIKRIAPALTVVQTNNGIEIPYFGDSYYTATSLIGNSSIIKLVDTSAKGGGMYLLGNPVFKQNTAYTFVVKAFEAYPFYDHEDVNNQGVIKQVNNINVINNVPTQDGLVSITNYLKDGAAGVDQFTLNTKGQGIYTFIAGEPNLAAQGIKNLNVTIQFEGTSNLNWQWLGNPQLSAYVLGSKITGTNFVTAGPDQLTMILRDPPGATSYSYAQKGTVITNSSVHTSTIDQSADLNLIFSLGVSTKTIVGLGVAVSTEFDVIHDLNFGLHHEEHWVNDSTNQTTTTLTTNFQTSGDPGFVGAPADVFVGNSTNITYGLSNNITITNRTDLAATDIILYQSDPASQNLVIERTGINVGQTFGTLFAYPQVHIENVLIPNLISIIQTILLPSSVTPVSAQQLANTSKKEIYVSKLDIADARFGKSNLDAVFYANGAVHSSFGDGPSYTIYFPSGVSYVTDTISTLNQYVTAWKDRMADNEKAKLQATMLQNYSFHAGSPITYSKQFSTNITNHSSFNYSVAGTIFTENGIKFNRFGFTASLGETVGGGGQKDTTRTIEYDNTYGFSLGSNGSNDYFSVDVKKAPDSSFVFLTRGGVSGCPYESATFTKYYLPLGQILDQPTMRIDVPKLSVDKPVVNDVPEIRKASYTLNLSNESEAKIDGSYLITYADDSTVKGATISIDGMPIGGGGRIISVPYGQTVQKVMTITKGPVAMDYNNIKIILKSGCQDDIADTILLSAHFIPACSDINIKSPADNWIVNTKAPVDVAGIRYLPIIMDQFDLNNSLFDRIELQYKPVSGNAWITAMKFYADTAKLSVADGDKQLILNASEINYRLVVDDASFNDQHYNIQAVSYCKLGVANFITTQSNMVSGIKDTYNPRLFGSPQPANGVLGISDNIRLNFNETIAAGLLTYTDFQVTGIRNGVQGDYSASVKLDGATDYLATEFNKNLTGKSTTTEMWILPDNPANGTIFSHGNANQSLELALTVDNYLEIIVGNKTIKSARPVAFKPGEWAHTALVYNATDQTVSAFYNFVEAISAVSVNVYKGDGVYQFGRSISKSGNFFSGKMHRVAIWSVPVTGTNLKINSLVQLSGAENNLLGFYPMDEGKGAVCIDKAHGSNATLKGSWSTPAGKAIKFGGNDYVKLSTGISPITSAMDYSMEMWFNADATSSNAAIVSNGRGDNTDAGGSKDNFFLGFENNILTFQNNGFKIQAPGNYLNNNWHHLALTVNRTSGIAQIYVDGAMKVSFDSKSIGGIASAYTYLGARAWNDSNAITVTTFDRYFKGSIDEFRVWNTYLNQTLINKNNNVRLQGDEIGLMTYYPFESYVTYQNNQQMVFSLNDQKVQSRATVIVPQAVVVNALESNDMAPIKDHGPVDNLKFDYVVNNDALIVNMLEPKQAIDKTIITIKVKNVKDINGNDILSPITWTAYIDQNQLKWGDNALNLTKAVTAPLQFETYVVNNGGNIQNYRLSNLPGWLTADMPSGSVQPLGKQKMTFTVSPGLNIGTYDEVIFMTNDNDVTEALTLNLVVKGKKPDWSVNPAAYNFNMNLYGNIRLNSLFSIDKEDLLGAFVNGKCVGLANNTFNNQSNLWFTYLTIYNNDSAKNLVKFRIWQARTGKVYEATPSKAVKFGVDSMIGTIRNPVIFDGMDIVYQDILLNQGWNWCSFNVFDSEPSSVTKTMANGNWTTNDVIKKQNVGFDQFTSSKNWSGNLQRVDTVSLFLIKTANAQTLSVSGTAINVTTTAIPVKYKWNFISYLPQINMTLLNGLAGYAAKDEDIIKSQDGFAMYDTRLGWIGNLTFLEPGKGYMLYRNQLTDTAFHYPEVKGFYRYATTDDHSAGGEVNSLKAPVAANTSYAQNMTVTAITGQGFVLQEGDWVLAYSGGEVRAKARLIANPVLNAPTLFFNISGDQELPVYFLVERNGVVVAESGTVITYGANARVGTLNKPLLLNFTENHGYTISVYPNPFTEKVLINITVPGIGNELHAVQIGVYNTVGELITRLPGSIAAKGIFQTSWNGNTANGTPCLKGIYFVRVTLDGITKIEKIIKN